MATSEPRFGLVDDEELERPEPEPVEASAAGSVLEVIRRRREERSAEREYDLLVPGYGGLLVLRCSPLRGDQQTVLRQRIDRSKDPAKDFALAADVLVAVCERVLARRTREGPLESLDPSGEDVGINARLAELLHVESTTARGLVRALFDKAPSPEMAAAKEVGEYLAWAQGEDVDLDDELLGESPAGRP